MVGVPCGAFFVLVELCENHLALTAVSRFVKKGHCVLARLCARMWFAYAHSAYIASFVVSDRQIAKPTCRQLTLAVPTVKQFYIELKNDENNVHC